jgi:hypothetical protein
MIDIVTFLRELAGGYHVIVFEPDCLKCLATWAEDSSFNRLVITWYFYFKAPPFSSNNRLHDILQTGLLK